MSWNIVLSDYDQKELFLLTRASAGITHSAFIMRGDHIQFNSDIKCEVMDVLHNWERPGTEKSPVSVARCVCHRPFTHEDHDKLLALGFKKLGT